jgi:uncharacterized protein (DUF1810 family)
MRDRQRGQLPNQLRIATMSSTVDDPFDLQRFVAAQDIVYAQVKSELAAAAKTSHWMWFVFPQLRGLGHSATARHYGLGSIAEAQAYWRHPVLGVRLRQCCELLAAAQGKTALEIFGQTDSIKLCSCLTLFERAAPQQAVFGLLLDRYYGGRRDAATLQML